MKKESNPAGMLPVLVLANPKSETNPAGAGKGKKERMAKKQTAKQAAASLRNLKKARAAKKKASNPAPKKKKKGGAKKPRARNAATNPSNPHKKKKPRKKARNPSNPATNPPKRRKKRKNPESTRTEAAVQVLGGLAVGGVAAGGVEYMAAGSEMLATPPRRAALSGAIGGALAITAIAVPKAAMFFGSVAGPFIGVCFNNIAKWVFSGSPAATGTPTGSGGQALADPNAQPAPGMSAVVVEPRLLQRGGMGAVIMDANSLRAVVMTPSRRVA